MGSDFCHPMLVEARRKTRAPLFEADALRLPLQDGSLDLLTVAFGLRNFADPERGLSEMRRVLRPGGRAVVLEFVRPRPGPLGAAYRAYLVHVLPRIGALVSGDRGAYRYLSQTVDEYRTPEELVALASRAGWREPRIDLLTLGTVGVLAGLR